jgi:hypothetical protein
MDSGNSSPTNRHPTISQTNFAVSLSMKPVWGPLHKPYGEMENCQDEPLPDPASPGRVAVHIMSNGKKS